MAAKKDEQKKVAGADAKDSQEGFSARLSTAPELAPQNESDLPGAPSSDVADYTLVYKDHETCVGYAEQVPKDQA